MKVWAVLGFSAEQYEDYTFLHSVHSTEEAALEHMASLGPQPVDENLAEYEYGYFTHEPEEFEVLK